MKPFWEGHPDLAADLDDVRAAIQSCAETDSDEIRAAVRHILSASGKMLRPGFVLLSSRFGPGGDRSRIIRAAAAIEMLHMATLVHDDIIDGASVRRGISTLNVLKGPRTAVLVGDWLLAASLSLVTEHARQDEAAALARLVLRVCGSEISQSTDRYRVSSSVRRYLRRIAGKTAALFALSCHVGAVEGGCAPEVQAALRRAGYCIGMGFQVIDDILDFSASDAETGKPCGSDLGQGIYTLPVVLALRGDGEALRRVLSRGRIPRRAVPRLTRIIGEQGGIDAARSYAAGFTARALREIAKLPAVPARDVLRDLAERLLSRTY
jgi:heptaprenyl diphosphate synthase